MLEYQNIIIFLQKDMFQIALKKFFMIKRVKNTVRWTYVINHLKGKEIVRRFHKKELQKNKSKRV